MNIDKEISALALELVKAQAKGPKASEYRSFCESFPALLRSAGLAQTVAFLKAKGGHPHGAVYEHLERQFQRIGLLEEKASLLETLIEPKKTPMAQYRLCSQMAIRVAQWHKRLAQAMVEKKKCTRASVSSRGPCRGRTGDCYLINSSR